MRLPLSAVSRPLFLVGAAFFGVWAADTGPGDGPGRGDLVAPPPCAPRSHGRPWPARWS